MVPDPTYSNVRMKGDKNGEDYRVEGGEKIPKFPGYTQTRS